MFLGHHAGRCRPVYGGPAKRFVVGKRVGSGMELNASVLTVIGA